MVCPLRSRARRPMISGARPLIRAMVAALFVAAAAPASFAQVNYDRPGGDYTHSPVMSGDPADCALQCERDRRCRAWSFNYPTYAAAEASCWLKNSVPPRIENNCCVSGVRGAGVVEQRTGAVEISTDRFGGDYRSFEMKASDKDEACRAACVGDNKCRAWTYVRPGYIGRDARCFLKNQIKPPRRKPGFMSGVVR